MKFKKTLTLLLLLFLISIAASLFIACDNGSENPNPDNPTGDHTHSYTAKVTQPTCTERGFTIHICSCGDSYVDTYVSALNHDYVNGVCSRCNSAEHSNDNPTDNPDKPNNNPTDNPNDNSPSGHTHSYVETVTQPTCTERGYTLHKCSDCDYYFVDTFIDALEHNYVDGVCTRCNQSNASEGLLYVVSADGTYYSLFGIGTCSETDVIIASVYNGLPVKEIGEQALYNNKFIKSVTIPDSVTTIGNSAFYGCSSLVNITIPDSITTFGSYAFMSCSSLTSVTISDSVTTSASGRSLIAVV